MRTDPRKACTNMDERLGWALLHDGIAHPLMAASLYSRLSVWFHDWTSHHAWPRLSPSGKPSTLPSRFGLLQVAEVAPGVYSVQHGHVAHKITARARCVADAIENAEAWFQTLADEFGGVFNPH